MNTQIPSVDVPDGQSGNWKIETFTVSEEEARFHNMRCAFYAGMARRTIKAGSYKHLMRGGCVVMSDTDAEKNDHWEAVYKANGVILLNGLGIGMVLNACLLKPEVQHAFVVENSSDVIALSAPHYERKFGSRVTIIQADALEYQPPKGIRFGAVWHDIWDNICGDNIPDMKRLHRRYGRRTDWQGSWCRYLCSL